jgi:hypothetical protein
MSATDAMLRVPFQPATIETRLNTFRIKMETDAPQKKEYHSVRVNIWLGSELIYS